MDIVSASDEAWDFWRWRHDHNSCQLSPAKKSMVRQKESENTRHWKTQEWVLPLSMPRALTASAMKGVAIGDNVMVAGKTMVASTLSPPLEGKALL